MKTCILYLLSVVLVTVTTVAATQVQQRQAGQNPQQPAARATVVGTVTRADSGQPVKGARVTLQAGARGQNARLGALAGIEAISQLASAARSVATVTTDANGQFSFQGVTPGQYRISAERDGYIRSEYGQRTPSGSGISVLVSANQRLTADMKMLQASVISGRVITSEGEAAADAEVQAYTYRYSDGERSLDEVKSTKTNDLGEYRLFGLGPGDYFVSVSDNQTESNLPVGSVDVGQTGGARGVRGGPAGLQILSSALGERGAFAGVLDEPGNPPIFYPGTLDPDSAIPVTVPAAVEVRGVDFNLRPTRTATVSGRVVAPFPLDQGNTTVGFRGRGGRGGQDDAPVQIALPTAPVQLNLSRVGGSSTGLASFLPFGSSPVNSDGTFEIKSVAPGEYNLMATARDPNGAQYTARTRISVGASDVGNITVSLRPGVEVRGRIVLDGTPPQNFRMTSIRVNLAAEDNPLSGILNFVTLNAGGEAGFDVVAADGARVNRRVAGLLGGQSITAEVAEDGSFTLSNVGATLYRVRVTGLPQGVYLQAGRIDSSDALNGPITVENEGSSLFLQLGFSPGRVSGMVLDDRGERAPGAQAVLVPDESRRGRTDAYFTATADQNGQFTFAAVPPGRYKLFSWEDIPAGAYQYADFIRRYEDRGQSLTVNPSGSITADARMIPAN